MKTQSKVLPTRGHWAAIISLSLLASISTLSLPGGWILFLFPAWIYLMGRGRMEEDEGLKK